MNQSTEYIQNGSSAVKKTKFKCLGCVASSASIRFNIIICPWWWQIHDIQHHYITCLMSVCIGGFQARHYAKDLHLQRHSNKLNPFLLLSPGHVSPITQIRCQCCHKGQHRDGKWILGNREIELKQNLVSGNQSWIKLEVTGPFRQC